MLRWEKRMFLAGAMSVVIAFAGCASSTNNVTVFTEKQLEEIASSDYPIKTEETLRVWTERGGSAIGNFSAPMEFPAMIQYQENLGVKLDWTFASTTQLEQSFNLMVASGDLPDIIGYYFANNGKEGIPGGPEKAIEDGWLADMSPYLKDYAPNYYKLLQEDEWAAKNVKTDSGQVYMAPLYIRSEDYPEGGVSAGYFFRQDWLDDLGLAVPETIDEWEIVLRAFKEKKGATAPLSLMTSWMDRGITSGFDVHLGWYQEDGVVKYGYAEPNYKNFVERMNKWYNEGLLDKNYGLAERKTIQANLLNGETGATFEWITRIPTFTQAGAEIDPNFKLIVAPYPVANKGDTPKFGTMDPRVYFAGWGISGTSKKKELAMKVIDYGYSKQGQEFKRWGTKDVTYILENGTCKFTDLITNNPDGLTFDEAKSYYFANVQQPGIISREDLLTKANVDEAFQVQVDQSIANCSKNDIEKYRLPYVTPKIEESSEYTRIQTDILKYVEEMMIKFITGKEPIENFDRYLAELDARGMQTLKDMMQRAYDRYSSR